MDKFSFVVGLQYVNDTIEDLYEQGLQIIEDESDFALGYFTVQGTTENLNEFKAFLNGASFI